VTTVTRCWLEEAEAIRLEDSLEPVTVSAIAHFGRNCFSMVSPKNGCSSAGKQMHSDGRSPTTLMRCSQVLSAIRLGQRRYLL
jgi:hypothetical protein